jgi:hypothetical protein|tara:strand:+ start:130 stop:1275 length:1146 start_codon:yes stop_codon:yes gene_type:complete
MFIFQYQDVVRKPINPMRNLNPLARASAKRVSLQDRVNQLDASNKWQKSIAEHEKVGRTWSRHQIPKIGLIPLGLVIVDEDVQRLLDEAHCANTIGGEKFKPTYLQPIFAAKNSKGEYVSIDGMHSSSTLAALIDAGLFTDCEDWKSLEYPTLYVETDDLSFARKAFGIVNGKGKKRQSKFNELRNAVFCIRIDGNTDDEDDVKLERKVSIAETHDCFAVEQHSGLAQKPGTFTHISLFMSLSESELDMAFGWHNKYFHYEIVHNSLFPIFRALTRDFEAARIKVTDTLLEEIAGLIQNLFGDLEQFQNGAQSAVRQWSRARYGYDVKWSDEYVAPVLLQLYKKMGGEEEIPLSLLERFHDPKTDTNIASFLDQEILDLAA